VGGVVANTEMPASLIFGSMPRRGGFFTNITHIPHRNRSVLSVKEYNFSYFIPQKCFFWVVLGTYMNVLVGGAGQTKILHDAVGRRGAIPGARGPRQRKINIYFH
jgi:hypothetical protein